MFCTAFTIIAHVGARLARREKKPEVVTDQNRIVKDVEMARDDGMWCTILSKVWGGFAWPVGVNDRFNLGRNHAVLCSWLPKPEAVAAAPAAALSNRQKPARAARNQRSSHHAPSTDLMMMEV